MCHKCNSSTTLKHYTVHTHEFIDSFGDRLYVNAPTFVRGSSLNLGRERKRTRPETFNLIGFLFTCSLTFDAMHVHVSIFRLHGNEYQADRQKHIATIAM